MILFLVPLPPNFCRHFVFALFVVVFVGPSRWLCSAVVFCVRDSVFSLRREESDAKLLDELIAMNSPTCEIGVTTVA